MHTEYVKQRTLTCIRVVGPYGQNYESATQKLYNGQAHTAWIRANAFLPIGAIPKSPPLRNAVPTFA